MKKLLLVCFALLGFFSPAFAQPCDIIYDGIANNTFFTIPGSNCVIYPVLCIKLPPNTPLGVAYEVELLSYQTNCPGVPLGTILNAVGPTLLSFALDRISLNPQGPSQNFGLKPCPIPDPYTGNTVVSLSVSTCATAPYHRHWMGFFTAADGSYGPLTRVEMCQTTTKCKRIYKWCCPSPNIQDCPFNVKPVFEFDRTEIVGTASSCGTREIEGELPGTQFTVPCLPQGCP